MKDYLKRAICITSAAAMLLTAGCSTTTIKKAKKENEEKKEAIEQIDNGNEQAAANEQTATGNAHHINAHGYDSWAIHYRTGSDGTNLQYYYLDENGQEVILSADEVNTLLNATVVTCGDMSLDNRGLQYYYNETLYNYSMNYGEYISYMLDTTVPFDTQVNSSSENGTDTWQKTFLDESIEFYEETAVMAMEAKAAGYEMTAEEQEYLNSLLDLDTMAMMYGYPDANTLVKAMIGPMATADSYKQFTIDRYTANFYLNHLAESMVYTDEELSAYYDENAESFAAQYVEKIDKNVVSVRHILIQPEAAQDGTITDAAWLTAEAEANRIYNEWKKGEATETSFGDLAGTYSTDTGSSSYGGLYEDVYPGQMVTEFNDWCFDDARKTGDTGIVKTDYGYHIMYYVAQGDYVYWKDQCKQELQAQALEKIHDEAAEKYELQVELPKAVLLESRAATKPAAN